MLNKNKINVYPLLISHHIFLTKEQRYDIYEGSFNNMNEYIESKKIFPTLNNFGLSSGY